MDKMWAGRFQKALDQTADDFNSSIGVDCRMYRQDIRGSLAHAAMLGAKGIISPADVAAIENGLNSILVDLDSGALAIDPAAEDIHMFIEAELTRRIGEAGQRLHTARSRNDQVALDIRLTLRDEITEMIALLRSLLTVLVEQADANKNTIMPGYTHLQRAQPITFGQHLLAYAMMLMRDIGRLQDTSKRMNYSPLGCCALAGTTYDTDRGMVAEMLGFDGVVANSLDGVSDRDFAIELASACSIIMMHLSRLSEELILWSSWEFRFVELDDAFTTGSSIMPQKKNPDLPELVRGKTGRVYGNQITLLTLMKGLPLAYNKDMQEDKEAIFDSVDTVKQCLAVMIPLLKTMHPLPDSMYSAAQKGFLNATDVADYLTRKGMPFRSAYHIVGQLVALCLERGETLDSLPLDIYQKYSPLFAADLYADIDMTACVQKRCSEGGTSAQSLEKQLDIVRSFLAQG